MLTGLIHPSSGTVRVAGHVPFRRQEAFLQKITLVMGQKQQLNLGLTSTRFFEN